MKKNSPHLLLHDLPFTKEILEEDGILYVCGGIVRDYFINEYHNSQLISKDLDIMVAKVPLEKLLAILEKTGKVDKVGESFGIIKYKQFGSEEDIDISLPRKEVFNGDRGHKSFDVTSDPFLPIETELSRRDLKINSILIDVHGNIIDPFNGLEDIKNKVISITNPDTFFDDELRMLRALVFSSRFNFTIEPSTFEIIKLNAHRIKEISSERILIELEKIVNKGNPRIGAELLVSSGLYDYIFNKKCVRSSFDSFETIKTMGEYIYILFSYNGLASEFYLYDLKGNIDTYKEIQALESMSAASFHSSYGMIRFTIFKALQQSPNVINTKLFTLTSKFLDEFKNGIYPKSLKELTINGNDLIKLGFVGKAIGDTLQSCIRSILRNEIKNETCELIEFAKCIKQNEKLLK